MIEWFSSLMDKFGNWLLNVLPRSPFRGFISNFHGMFDDGLCYLNWFISFRDLKVIFLVWLGVVSVYYVYSIVMRWVKML